MVQSLIDEPSERSQIDKGNVPPIPEDFWNEYRYCYWYLQVSVLVLVSLLVWFHIKVLVSVSVFIKSKYHHIISHISLILTRNWWQSSGGILLVLVLSSIPVLVSESVWKFIPVSVIVYLFIFVLVSVFWYLWNR